jgi:hypothetical protein
MVRGSLSFLMMAILPVFSVEPVSEFVLQDKNQTSIRFEQDVSPSDYRHLVSAYYFGQAS